MVQMDEESEIKFRELKINGGNSYIRYVASRRKEDIDSAIIHLRSAATMSSEAGFLDIPLMRTMALFYMIRIEHACGSTISQSDLLSDVNQAIWIYNLIIPYSPLGKPELELALSECYRRRGSALNIRYQTLHEQEDLDEAIKSYNSALEHIPSDQEDVRAEVLHASAAIIRDRFDQTKNLEDIADAIHAHQSAISMTPEGDPKLAERLIQYTVSVLSQPPHARSSSDLNDVICRLRSTTEKSGQLVGDLYRRLGDVLTERYRLVQNEGDLNEAVKSASEYIPMELENVRAIVFNNIAVLMQFRFGQTEALDDILSAVDVQKRAIAMTPEGDSSLSTRLYEYWVSVISQPQHLWSSNDLSDAISCLRSTVDLEDTDISLERRLMDLSIALTHRFQQTMHLDDIMEAIDCQKRAIALTKEGEPNFGLRIHMLGGSYHNLYRRTGNMNHLEEAILLHRRANDLVPNDHTIYINLGATLRARFLRTDDIADITEAIEFQKRALKLTPEGGIRYGKYLNSLAESYKHLSRFNDDMYYLTEAITVQRRAIDHSARYDISSIGESWDSLGDLLLLLFLKHPTDKNIINESISSHQKAVDATPSSYSAYATYLEGLGQALHIRFDHFQDINDIERAISLIREAIQISPVDSPIRSFWLQNLGRAHLCFSEFLGPTVMNDNITQGISSLRESSTHPYGNIITKIKSANIWTVACFKVFDPTPYESECVESVTVALELLPKVAWLGFDMNVRQLQLRKLAKLSGAAGNIGIYFGKNELAFEWIEHARGIIWSQLNNLRTPIDSLRAREGHLADEVLRIARELEQAGRWETDGSDIMMHDKIITQQQIIRRQELADKWESIVREVREVEGFKDFLQAMKFNDLSQGIPESGLVVIISLAMVVGSHALTLKHGAKSVIKIPLPANMRTEHAKELYERLNKHLLSNGVRTRKGRPAKIPDSNVLEEILSELWIKIMKPIVDGLHLLPSLDNPTRIWWCPVGPLAFLPLHAAGNYGKRSKGLGSALSDFVISSYIPTVTSLVKKMQTRNQQRFKGVLLVSQPNAPKLPPIPGAAKECDDLKKLCVSKGVECTYLDESASEVVAVSQAMENHSWVHLACHASQDADPAKSSFYLRDGELDLASISKKPLLNADFAFLSACQTSTGEAALSEESMHLAAGMYTAGYRSVIATMWSISDEYAPRIAKEVYSHLLRGSETESGRILDSSDASEALHRATRVLREELGEDKYLAWVPYVHIGV